MNKVSPEKVEFPFVMAPKCQQPTGNVRIAARTQNVLFLSESKCVLESLQVTHSQHTVCSSIGLTCFVPTCHRRRKLHHQCPPRHFDNQHLCLAAFGAHNDRPNCIFGRWLSGSSAPLARYKRAVHVCLTRLMGIA